MNSFKFQLKTFLPCLLLAMTTLFTFTACEDDNPKPKTEFFGPEISVGDGKAKSFVKTDNLGEPIEIGFMFDEKALQNLPTGDPHGHEYKLKLPTDVDIAPFNHITFDWNEHGHEPPGVYDLPHFDCHFYFISEAERGAIGPNDTLQFNKPLPAENLPPNYLETPGGVPGMGAHVVDLLSPEIAGTGVFTKTFIFGKYDGELVFIEPMITMDYLKGKPNVSTPIRQPQKWQQDGYYPASYDIRYNASSKMYSIVMQGLQHFHK
ncbi:MAG: DUF5602 domain-containing protein [Saprospiraceae bacterium]|nr:DUF5602 domain-containing protein [Saprospiraceae bacterium]